jgi:tetratricopeptide (TPR) repeat protein
VILALVLLLYTPAFAAPPEAPMGERYCQSDERWTPAQPFAARARFGVAAGAPARSFAEGLALRRGATDAAEAAFGEYWASRALLEAGLVHQAREGFSAVASREAGAKAAPARLAAVGCLERIAELHPSLATIPAVEAVLPKLARLARPGAELEAARAYAARVARELAARDPESASAALALLPAQSPGAELARAFLAAATEDHERTIEETQAFLASNPIPAALRRYEDSARLLLSRALYSTGKFDRATDQLRKLHKGSNELAESLSELAWAYLQEGRAPEAIGAAMNLQAGGLRHTFAPEGPMVMAMALNEICQYPESVTAIRAYRRGYAKARDWLAAWTAGGMQPLYASAVEFLRKQGEVPDRVGSEWIRSPLFISSQDEINLIYDEAEAAAALGRSGSREQQRLSAQLLEQANKLLPDIKLARMKPGPLPKKVLAAIEDLRETGRALRRMRAAAPVWSRILLAQQKRAPTLEHTLVARIETDLRDRSQRMLEQLDEVAENIQLVEVEIYDGASADIIWQNAHPEFKKMAHDLDNQESGTSASKTWNWGRAPGSDDSSEIWEDELGSFKANLYDNCASKDRFLALKTVQRRTQ